MNVLYHGTAARYLPSIQEKGIAPRSKTKAKDHWKHTVSSNRNAVYLTDAYAWHFAAHASDEERGLVLEVDHTMLNPFRLCPDEDFLEQVTRKRGPTASEPIFAQTDWDMKKRTKHYRKLASTLQHMCKPSLEHMGTAAYYGVIPWEAVTRYVIIDWKKLDPFLYLQAVDSIVSVMNYSILQDRHRALTRWFFGDPVTAGQVTGNDGWSFVGGFESMIQQHNENAARAMQNRNGLQVFSLRKEFA